MAVERDNAGENGREGLRGVELHVLLARACGKLSDQVFVGVTKHVPGGGELRDALGNLGDDDAERFVALGGCGSVLFEAEVDLGKKTLAAAGEGFVLDVLKAAFQGLPQLGVLGACALVDAAPEIIGVDDVMNLAAYLFLQFRHIGDVVSVPDGQRCAAVFAGHCEVVRPELLLHGGLVVVGEVAQEQERQHVVEGVFGVHCAVQVVVDAPEGFAELVELFLGHAVTASGLGKGCCISPFSWGLGAASLSA